MSFNAERKLSASALLVPAEVCSLKTGKVRAAMRSWKSLSEAIGRRLGVQAEAVGRRLGFQVTPLELVNSVDGHLRQLFKLYEFNCVIDVGAHKGLFGRLVRSIGYTGPLLSFEPLKKNFEELQDVLEGDPQWKAFNVALGARESTAEINVANETMLSSFLSVSEYGSLTFGRDAAVVQAEVVQVETLDNHLSDIQKLISNPRIFLKLDSQGFDVEVIKGATQTLPHVHGLLSEVSVKPIYTGMPAWRDAISIYESYGFVASDRALRVIEYDCVMAKAEEAIGRMS